MGHANSIPLPGDWPGAGVSHCGSMRQQGRSSGLLGKAVSHTAPLLSPCWMWTRMQFVRGAVGSHFETMRGSSIGCSQLYCWKSRERKRAWVEGLNLSPLTSSLPLGFLLWNIMPWLCEWVWESVSVTWEESILTHLFNDCILIITVTKLSSEERETMESMCCPWSSELSNAYWRGDITTQKATTY